MTTYAPSITIRTRELKPSKTRPRVPSVVVDSPRKMYDVAKNIIGDAAHEHFLILFLNSQLRIIAYDLFTSGSIRGVYVDTDGIFRSALVQGAYAIVTAHQHPSGSLEPSREDRALWETIDKMGRTLHVPVLDNMVITNQGYYANSSNETVKQNPARFAWHCPSPPEHLEREAENLTDFGIVDYIHDHAEEIDPDEFAKLVGGWQTVIDDWWGGFPSGGDFDEDAEMIRKDWSVSWYRSQYPDGTPIVFHTASGIEHVYELPRSNPSWGPGRGRGYKFAGTEEILDLIEEAEPNDEYVEDPNEDDFTERFHGRKVVWLSHGGHYVLKVPVENVHFMEGNLWYPEHGAALLERIEESGSDKARLELPAARVYRITKADVKAAQRYEDEGELDYQLGMVEPWEMSDVGDYHVQLIDGNHRAAAAMLAGEPYIYVYVSENYRDNVKPGDWE